MKKAGVSLSEIAADLGLTSGGEVNRMLQEHIKQEAAFLTGEERTGILLLEWERLEDLIRANYTSAMMADPKSADIMLKAVAMQIKLAQLDAPDAATQTTQVLVVGGQEVEYVEALKKMAE